MEHLFIRAVLSLLNNSLISNMRCFTKNMFSTFFRTVFLLVVLTGALFGTNKYPVILIHGYIGWGQEEMGGYNYWGGFNNLEKELRDQGYEVYSVSVGPVSSNWERAIEAYYQIKGGQIDYGEAHSDLYGVTRKPVGKVYEGLYPQWDKDHPVHLIGHSMGGQTARMLLYQLKESFYIDDEAIVKEESNLLGSNSVNWIASITSIATPHNGTTLTEIVNRTIPFIQNFIGIAAAVGTDFYNFDLQHWGFDRGKDETWTSYFQRMREHPAWNTKNICAWDLSLEGARQLNTLLIADPEVYYFSFICSTTKPDDDKKTYIPVSGTSIVLRSRARLLGFTEAYWADGTKTDSTWFNNDGVVNTVSQFGPTTGLSGEDAIGVYKSGDLLIPGQWYSIGPLDYDHWKIIGHGVLNKAEIAEINKLYSDHLAVLMSLP